LTATIPALSSSSRRRPLRFLTPADQMLTRRYTATHLVKEQCPNVTPVTSEAWRIIAHLAEKSRPNFLPCARHCNAARRPQESPGYLSLPLGAPKASLPYHLCPQGPPGCTCATCGAAVSGLGGLSEHAPEPLRVPKCSAHLRVRSARASSSARPLKCMVPGGMLKVCGRVRVGEGLGTRRTQEAILENTTGRGGR